MALLPIRHVGLKVVSIGVATLLWLVVTSDPQVERTLRVSLELQRTPAGVELVGDVPDTVAVRVRGAASRLAGLGTGDLSAVVDLDGVRPGRRLFALTASQVTAPFGVEVVQITPPSLALAFEPTATATLPVQPRVEGTPAPGHSVTNISVTPSQVRVQGPESAVRDLTALFTEPVSLNGATQVVREVVTIDAAEAGLRLDGGATAVVTVTLSADTTERTIVGVPVVRRGGPPGGVTPAEVVVTVEGARAVVEGLSVAELSLFVDGAGVPPGRELVVQAESSPRFVVKSIQPSTVRVGPQALRR